MAKQTKPSSNWAISPSASLGKGKGSVGAGYIALTLFDVDSQLYFSLGLLGASLGGGIPAGATVSTFSPSFFTTPTPMWAQDFGGRLVNISGAELSIGVGGGITYLTFHNINHEPYWLDIGGVEAGIAGGIATGFYGSMVYENDGWENNGCRIQPDGDPMCGGKSPSPQYSTQDQNMSTMSSQ
ncbi:hypothetical protein [Spirosoma pollinicola]|uniref:Uncharacterized protein n=1 Tax=Spirosoma pollinicola TaxID=2057025 RepID=A0A2K8ZBC7_9BACT|nr:hypothetical protein [Spirosoma pollinicola]AUD07155.1 hypothetical protein CWM47_04190 [Spirosoma pollinicola]